MTEKEHYPVLLEEVLELLDAGREGIYVDCTLGPAGHAVAILERNPRSFLIGLDRDELSLRTARKNLEPYGDRVKIFHADFRKLAEIGVDFGLVRGVLLDLGLSSLQLDDPARGFSYNREGPLDMRMDLRSKITARKILHEYSEWKLAELFARYGELNRTRLLAREIVSLRKLGLIETTSQLRQLIEKIYNWRPQKGKIHPAAKVFQALRIEVNQELEGLGQFLASAASMFHPGTRLAVVSFHSLEDRIVKRTFADLSGRGERERVLNILTKKPVTPSQAEIEANSRARSAKLRAAVRA